MERRTPAATVESVKVMANTTRMRLYEALSAEGPCTNAQLAATVGIAPGSVSWHLHQLEAIGFVERIEPPQDGADARLSWWRAIPGGLRWGDGEEDPSLALALDEARRLFVERRADRMRRWAAEQQSHWSPTWRSNALDEDSVLHLTEAQLAQLNDELREVLARWLARDDARREASDAVPVYVLLQAFPFHP